MIRLLLILALAASEIATFTFTNERRTIEGYIAPSGSPQAVILYFHRAIEDRKAAIEWGKLLGASGYVVAGFTATPTSDLAAQGKSALDALRSRKELRNLPIVLMGASLGTRAAAELFVAERQARALVLIVPGRSEICEKLKDEKRPVFLIQAENDEVVANNEEVHRCLSGVQYLLLRNTGHRFPPSQVSKQILDWLDSL